jgi:hypothetical protein
MACEGTSPATRKEELLWGVIVPTTTIVKSAGALATSDKIRLAYGNTLAHELGHDRTKVSIVRMVDRLWDQPVERQVLLALAESIFEYNPEWYGKRRNPPVAPDWSTAPPEAREAAAALGRKLLKRGDLPASLRAAIQATPKP